MLFVLAFPPSLFFSYFLISEIHFFHSWNVKSSPFLWHYWLLVLMILDYGGSPVHCRVFSSILGLYQLKISSNPSPQVMQHKISLTIAQCPCDLGLNYSDWEITVLYNLLPLALLCNLIYADFNWILQMFIDPFLSSLLRQQKGIKTCFQHWNGLLCIFVYIYLKLLRGKLLMKTTDIYWAFSMYPSLL